METIYSDGKTLEIERKLKITVFLPQLCYFCGEEITMFGIESDSLVFHSLDGDHSNWEPSNKVSCHNGCHKSFHHTGKVLSEKTKQLIRNAKLGTIPTEKTRQRMSDVSLGKPKTEEHRRNISKGTMGKPKPWLKGNPRSEETKLKIAKTLKGKPHPWQEGDKNVMCRPEQRQRMRGENPMKNPETAAKARRTKLERYGYSGMTDPEAHGRAVSKGRMKATAEERSEAAKKGVKTRRKRYGPSGMRPRENTTK